MADHRADHRADLADLVDRLEDLVIPADRQQDLEDLVEDPVILVAHQQDQVVQVEEAREAQVEEVIQAEVAQEVAQELHLLLLLLEEVVIQVVHPVAAVHQEILAARLEDLEGHRVDRQAIQEEAEAALLVVLDHQVILVLLAALLAEETAVEALQEEEAKVEVELVVQEEKLLLVLEFVKYVATVDGHKECMPSFSHLDNGKLRFYLNTVKNKKQTNYRRTLPKLENENKHIIIRTAKRDVSPRSRFLV